MMKRLLLATALLLLPASAWAQPTNPLTRVFVIPISGDCETTPCSIAGKQMCRETATATTAFMCNGSSGFYDIGISSSASAGGANTQVQFNDSAAFGGDSGLTFNKTTDALTVGGTLTSTLGNLVLSGAGATVDGKNLDFIAANTKFVHVCPTGCEYATLAAACAGETSTSAAPVTVYIHPGVYTSSSAIDCSSQDSMTIEGDGPSTFLDISGVTGETSTLLFGVNTTVHGFKIRGHRAIGALWAGTNAGNVTIYDMELESEGVASDEDCAWFDQPGSGTNMFFRDNRCNTLADGFTINDGGAGVTFTSIGNLFARKPGGANNGYFYAFEGIPCAINVSADVIASSGDYNATSTRYMNIDGTQTGCAAGAIVNVSGVTGAITNTEATGAGSVKFVDINSTATEVANVNLMGNSILLTNGSSAGSATNVDLQNATTEVNVYGGRYRSTGTGAVDFKVAGGAAGATFKLWGVDYTNTTAPGSEFSEGDPKKVVSTEQALFTGSASITYQNSNGGVDGVIIENTDSVNDEASPDLVLTNGGASRESWRFRTISSGRLDLVNPSGSTVMDWRTGGNALDISAGLQLTNRFASPMLKLGDGTNIDTMALSWDGSGTDLTLGMNMTAARMETNAAQWRMTGSASAPATCSIGDVYIDTTAGSVAWCLCTAANTWTAVGGTGTCS